MRVADPTSEERYCAYIDILGFSNFIAGMREDPKRSELARRLLYALKLKPDQSYLGAAVAADLRVQSISDAICMSTARGGAGLVHLFMAAETLAFRILGAGYLTRGAIVRGQLYHDEEVAFGEALVKAYSLEKSVVRFPRIMITRDVFLDAEQLSSHEVFGPKLQDSIEKATDGPYYLNILRHIRGIIELTAVEEYPDPEYRDQLMNSLKEIARMLQTRFDEAADNPSHFDKVRWFANYWNASITPYPTLPRVFGAGLDFPPFQDNRIIQS
jgi:hypothetical protein